MAQVLGSPSGLARSCWSGQTPPSWRTSRLPTSRYALGSSTTPSMTTLVTESAPPGSAIWLGLHWQLPVQQEPGCAYGPNGRPPPGTAVSQMLQAGYVRYSGAWTGWQGRTVVGQRPNRRPVAAQMTYEAVRMAYA